MTLGQLLENVTIYHTVAVFRNDAIEGAEEFSCFGHALKDEAMGDGADENLLECEVLSMFAQTLEDGQVALCIGLDWEGDE